MKENNSKILPADVDATLSYGQVFASKVWKTFLIVIDVLIGVCFQIVVCTLIFYPITVGKYDSNIIIFIIGTSIIVLMLSICMVLLHRFSLKGERYVKIRLEDAVILSAFTQSLEKELAVRNIFVAVASAIKVTFNYNGKNISKKSMHKERLMSLAVYTKYVDKDDILIAYSPKYDEVMLIKPSSVERIKQSLNQNSNN